MAILRAEGDLLRPSFSYEERHRHASRSSREVSSPVVQVARRNPVKTRAFTLEWTGVSGTEGQRFLLNRAWESSYGSVLTMDFTPFEDVDANSLKVAFVENSLSMRRTGPVTWQMSVQVEEVL